MSPANRNHLPSLDTMARLVAPTLGGLLLGGLFVPPAALGSILGAVAGLMVGLTRNHDLAKLHG